MRQTAGPGEKLKGLATGRTYKLGAFIASGGEGKVYALDGQPGLVAKIYFSPLSRAKAKKLAEMIAMSNPDLEKISAWPVDIVVNAKKEALGFVMPYVADGLALHLLFSPTTRLQQMPRLNFANMVRVAENIARAVATLHQAGIVIGDINGQNFLVRPNGHVHAIDCDSMQIGSNRKWGCGVGVEEYVAPELQGRSLTNIRRTKDHDVFAMAVLIFELLGLGRHPFAGHPEIPLGTAIKQGLHVFHRNAPPRNLFVVFALKPTQILDRALVELFARAFACPKSGIFHTSRSRPSAHDWCAALSRFNASLVECTSKTGHLHPPAARDCPWCALDAKKLTIFRSSKKTATHPAQLAAGSQRQRRQSIISSILRFLVDRVLTTVGYLLLLLAVALWGFCSWPFINAWHKSMAFAYRKYQTAVATIRKFVSDTLQVARVFLRFMLRLVLRLTAIAFLALATQWLLQ